MSRFANFFCRKLHIGGCWIFHFGMSGVKRTFQNTRFRLVTEKRTLVGRAEFFGSCTADFEWNKKKWWRFFVLFVLHVFVDTATLGILLAFFMDPFDGGDQSIQRSPGIHQRTVAISIVRISWRYPFLTVQCNRCHGGGFFHKFRILFKFGIYMFDLSDLNIMTFRQIKHTDPSNLLAP